MFAGVIAGCLQTATTPIDAWPAAATPSRAPAQQTCADFAVAALSIDAAIDRGPADARRRAALEYGTHDLATQLNGNGDDPDWRLLLQQRARVTVTTTPVTDDPPPYASRTAAAVVAHRVATNSRGWRQPLPDQVAYCTLATDGERWRVTEVGFEPNGAP